MSTLKLLLKCICLFAFLSLSKAWHYYGTHQISNANQYTSSCVKCKVNESPWSFEQLIYSSFRRKQEKAKDDLIPETNKLKVKEFLSFYEPQASRKKRRLMLAKWNKATNLTEHNTKVVIEEEVKFLKWGKKTRKYANDHLSEVGLDCDETRKLKYIKRTASVEEAKLRNESLELSARIEKIYSEAEVCGNPNKSEKCYKFEPGLINLFAKSRNYDELLWAWKGLRDAVGPKVRQDWIRNTNILNKGSRDHGYSDLGDYWRSSYYISNFKSRVESLWDEIEPLYQQLHSYVRYKLHKKYGNKVSLTGPIPGHLLGDIWGMQWGSIYDICEPYGDVGEFSIDAEMKKKKYTVHKMFQLADEFYQSIGLPAMPDSFWEKSMMTRPEGRQVVCYASAYNLEKTDVRIKMCSQVNQEYLYVIHHEMGHCQYYLGYNLHQSDLFQGGANSGFHEAIGDTAALSVINPTHLEKLGLIKKDTNKSTKNKRHINFLMKRALQKLAFYPYALSLDTWRWNVFSGKVKPENLNSAWWQERTKRGGIAPPIDRSENDFDPAAKYHVTYGVPYIRYFISHILEFTFYESMCNYAGHEGPLFLCDFGGSKTAGKHFADMLNAGNSQHWKDILKKMTGSCEMTTSSMKRYFQPLLQWLKIENKRLGNKIGWE